MKTISKSTLIGLLFFSISFSSTFIYAKDHSTENQNVLDKHDLKGNVREKTIESKDPHSTKKTNGFFQSLQDKKESNGR